MRKKEKVAEVPLEEIWHVEGAGSQKDLFSSAGRVTLSMQSEENLLEK